IVPPMGACPVPVAEHARGLVGYVDAVNLTDNPVASAHMSPLAGVRFVAEAGIEPTVQLTVRDRNRLGLTADLLGAWALGARNVFCLSGDPVHVGDHPDAVVVADLAVGEVIGLARRMRDAGTPLANTELADDRRARGRRRGRRRRRDGSHGPAGRSDPDDPRYRRDPRDGDGARCGDAGPGRADGPVPSAERLAATGSVIARR